MIRAPLALHALRRAKERYAGGDFIAARRNLDEAAAMLSDMAERMEPPVRADVWILANDLRLLRISDGVAKPLVLDSLTGAETRASALAAQHADWISTRAPGPK